MTRQGEVADWRPTAEQALLLNAALLPAPAATDAWQVWQGLTDLDNLPAGSYRLLPCLYRNLTALGAQPDWAAQLKGIYRRTWYSNNLLLHAVSEVLGTWGAMGISPVVFGGAALLTLYYDDLGARELGGVDVLIPQGAVRAALSIARTAGWTPAHPATRSFHKGLARGLATLPLRDRAGHMLLLHWKIIVTERRVTNGLLASGEAIIAGIMVRVPNPVEQLLDICESGVRAGGSAPLTWIADALAILRAPAAGVGWEILPAMAQRSRTLLPSVAALRYLAITFDAPIPFHTLAAMEQMPVSWEERIVLPAWARLCRTAQRIPRGSLGWRALRAMAHPFRIVRL